VLSTGAIEHHRLRSAEKELLENTLIGSMRALTEVLSIADPVAFGRVPRLNELAMLTAARLAIWETWPIEYATLVCQIARNHGAQIVWRTDYRASRGTGSRSAMRTASGGISWS
jgi:hypothetical protein